MGKFRFNECCPECGHMLTNDRTNCPFCYWQAMDTQTPKPTHDFFDIDALTIDSNFSHILLEDAKINPEAVV